jgi:hypothetical protein
MILTTGGLILATISALPFPKSIAHREELSDIDIVQYVIASKLLDLRGSEDCRDYVETVHVRHPISVRKG